MLMSFFFGRELFLICSYGVGQFIAVAVYFHEIAEGVFAVDHAASPCVREIAFFQGDSFGRLNRHEMMLGSNRVFFCCRRGKHPFFVQGRWEGNGAGCGRERK